MGRIGGTVLFSLFTFSSLRFDSYTVRGASRKKTESCEAHFVSLSKAPSTNLPRLSQKSYQWLVKKLRKLSAFRGADGNVARSAVHAPKKRRTAMTSIAKSRRTFIHGFVFRQKFPILSFLGRIRKFSLEKKMVETCRFFFNVVGTPLKYSVAPGMTAASSS
jgi:hypothetical protein